MAFVGGASVGRRTPRTGVEVVCSRRPSAFVGASVMGAGSPAVMMAPSTVARKVTVTAKMYDWKRRGNEKYSGEMEVGTMAMHTLIPAPGSTHRKKRIGRGVAAGQGRSCGYGMRGQKSRSGTKGVRPGFEGGQTPLYRKVSKWVGRPMGPGHTRIEYGLIKLDHLNKCEDGAEVSYESLLEAGVMTKLKRKLVKVVGGGEVTAKNLTVRAHAFTTSAVEAIEGAGGKCVLLSPTTGEDIILDGDDTEIESGSSSSETSDDSTSSEDSSE